MAGNRLEPANNKYVQFKLKQKRQIKWHRFI